MVELMPSATSNSPFSLGRVKLLSLPDPNILKPSQEPQEHKEAKHTGLAVLDLHSNRSDRDAERLPSQHGVGLGGEDGRVHHEAGVVHDQGDSLPEPRPAAVALLAAQLVHVDGVGQSLGAELRHGGAQRVGDVRAERRSSALGAPRGARAGRPGRRAPVAAFAVCGGERPRY